MNTVKTVDAASEKVQHFLSILRSGPPLRAAGWLSHVPLLRVQGRDPKSTAEVQERPFEHTARASRADGPTGE